MLPEPIHYVSCFPETTTFHLFNWLFLYLLQPYILSSSPKWLQFSSFSHPTHSPIIHMETPMLPYPCLILLMWLFNSLVKCIIIVHIVMIMQMLLIVESFHISWATFFLLHNFVFKFSVISKIYLAKLFIKFSTYLSLIYKNPSQTM